MDIIRHNPPALALPAPRAAINIRPGTIQDIPFIDALQKKMNRQLGWMPRKQLEGKIGLGHVLVAESGETKETRDETKETRDESSESGSLVSRLSSLSTPVASLSTPLGYIIGNDQYFKRDDVGCIFQLCVVEGQRRGLIGAALVKAMFERAAYGCRLFCCWCAQDLEANRFWESLGFVPIAFRTGSRTKGKGKTPRVHIFWQKRIREGDNETPYWFPSKTSGGALGEDRLVLPIPPGTHWSDEMPMFLPEQSAPVAASLPDAGGEPGASELRPKKKPAPAGNPQRPVGVAPGGLWFAPKPPPRPAKHEKPARKPARKHDPKHVAAARELRDRFLEAVTREPNALVACGKYEVTRALPVDEPRASASGSGSDRSPTVAAPLEDGRGSLPQVVEVRALPAAA